MANGQVENREAAWGTIRPDGGGASVYFYPESVTSPWGSYIPGQRVRFDLNDTGNQAVRVDLA